MEKDQLNVRRKPVCVSIATVLAAALLFFFWATNSHADNGAGEGYPADFGAALVKIGVMLLLDIIGIGLLVTSLLRKEKFPIWAIVSLVVYLLPFILLAFVLKGNGPANH